MKFRKLTTFSHLRNNWYSWPQFTMHYQFFWNLCRRFSPNSTHSSWMEGVCGGVFPKATFTRRFFKCTNTSNKVSLTLIVVLKESSRFLDFRDDRNPIAFQIFCASAEQSLVVPAQTQCDREESGPTHQRTHSPKRKMPVRSSAVADSLCRWCFDWWIYDA